MNFGKALVVESCLRRVPRAILTVGSLLAAGCAPVFSDLQSAKLVGRDRVEVTPAYTYVQHSDTSIESSSPPCCGGPDDDGESSKLQDEWGLQLATGVHERIDLRARYVYVEGIHVLGFGPKLGLVRDKVALHLPVGFAFGEDVDSGESWQIHPTLLLTAPVNRHVELNASAKALIPFSDGDTLAAFNVGAGFGDLDRWAIRPEIGFMFNPGDSGHYTQFSVGFTLFTGQKRPRP
jgi:hypothetical protein